MAVSWDEARESIDCVHRAGQAGALEFDDAGREAAMRYIRGCEAAYEPPLLCAPFYNCFAHTVAFCHEDGLNVGVTSRKVT